MQILFQSLVVWVFCTFWWKSFHVILSDFIDTVFSERYVVFIGRPCICTSSVLQNNVKLCTAITTITRHRASTSTRWYFAFALCCSNETRAPIANPPSSAQLEGTPYHSSNLHPDPCSSVGMRRRTDRRAWLIYISLRVELTRNVTILLLTSIF